MHRPGVMAPPTLYDEPARVGMMRAGAAAPPFEIDLRHLLWSIVVVLAAVELFLALVPN